MSGSMTRRAYLELHLRPDTHQIVSLTRLVAEVYGGLLGDADATSRVVLTVHEMLENIAKYATDPAPCFSLELSESSAGGHIRVETRNCAAAPQLARAQALIQTLNGPANPRDTYRELMTVTATEREGSGLGLARIRAEAGMHFEYQIEADCLTIVARGPVPLKERP
jgi:hypothetical protein